ncbi:MAG TPA: response regulator [Azospirillum sp.]|nr:response regulator [Azospirillum sp.]
MTKVLVIDDEDMVRLTLCQMLEVAGYEVTEASDGRKGVAMQAAHPADIVLTDILMPGQEGIETIIQLRQLTPGVKVIAISGGARVNNVDLLEVARTMGADAVLAKPFTMRELIGALNDCLGKPAT